MYLSCALINCQKFGVASNILSFELWKLWNISRGSFNVIFFLLVSFPLDIIFVIPHHFPHLCWYIHSTWLPLATYLESLKWQRVTVSMSAISSILYFCSILILFLVSSLFFPLLHLYHFWSIASFDYSFF